MIKISLTLFCALFSQWAAASYFAQNNATSLLQRNAEIVAPGDVTVDLSVFADGYKAATGTAQDTDGFVILGVAYGLNDRLALGLMAPEAIVDKNNSGLRHVNAAAKFLLGGHEDDGVVVSLSGYADLFSAQAADGLSSGSNGYGLLMNVSFFGDRSILHFSVGGEKGDIKLPGTNAGFSSEQQFVLSAGLEYQLNDQWEYMLEGLFSRTNDLDDNFLLMPGIRYTASDKLNFYLGAALGLPSDTSIPEWRITTGVSFDFGQLFVQEARQHNSWTTKISGTTGITNGMTDVDKTVRHPITARTDTARPGLLKVSTASRESTANISAADALLLQQIEALRGEVGKLINTPPNVIARIEIQNASGVRGLGEKVAKLLASRGYSVVSINDIAKSIDRPTKIYYQGGAKNAEIVRIDRARLGVLKQTRIYFIEGFQQRATRVSMTLPGSQRVMPDVDLINAAEIRIVLGKDMKALLKKNATRHRPSA